jgi:TolA-binding protein
MTTHTPPGTASRDEPLGPAGRAPGQLWQVPTFFAGLLAVLAVAVGAGSRHTPAVERFDCDITALRAALKQPGTPPDSLLTTADDILVRAREMFPDRAAEAHFLLGLVHARRGDRAPPDRAGEERKQARLHLEQAEAQGLPPEDQPRLHYYLGKLLFLSGGDLPRVIDYLSHNTARGAEDLAEGYGLLTQAYLRLRPPDVEAALRANAKQLENTDDEVSAGTARLLRAELLLGKQQRAEALAVLRYVGPNAPADVRLKARYLQARCAQEEGFFSQAVPLWKELLANPGAIPGGRAHVLYGLGVCYAGGDPRDEAAAETAWKEAAALGGPDGQAAALRLAELALRRAEQHGPDKDAGAALRWFHLALDKVAAVSDYQNQAVSLDQARELIELGCRIYREGQDHERALELAELYRKVALPGVAEEHLAQAAEARADCLTKKAAADLTPAERAQAQSLYRQAGAAYEQAAVGRLPAEKALRLRRGAACYLQAQGPEDHARAAELLKQFIELIPEPERKAEGWFALAGTHRALKDNAQATKAYYECIQYPKTPLIIRARLELAELEAERGKPAEAEKILKQNLALNGPSPDRQAQEESLYRLGQLLFQRKQYDDAVFRLTSLIDQYPYSPHVPMARDTVGICYQKLADDARQASGSEHPILNRSVRRENLQKALDVYESQADELQKRAAAGKKLSPLEEVLLRRAQFAAADCLFELPNNFAEAVRRYVHLAEENRGRVEALWACQRLAHCCSMMPSDLAQARETITAARAVIRTVLEDVSDPSRMPEKAFQVRGNEKYVKGQSEPVGWIGREDWRGFLTSNLATLDAAISSRPAPASGH